MADRPTWNPFRSEAEAYQLLIATIAFFAAVVLASVFGGAWASVAVFIALALASVAWFLVRNRHVDRRDPVGPVRTGGDQRRVLVVANETVAGKSLHDAVRRASAGERSSVLVVSPALNSPLRHFVSDEGRARKAAQERLDRSLAALGAVGIEARGQVGDADPLQAIEDALRTFGADEIIISTHPEGRSNWLERGVVVKARERFTAPVTHVVVDLEAESREASR